jgi:hypothetical protein
MGLMRNSMIWYERDSKGFPDVRLPGRRTSSKKQPCNGTDFRHDNFNGTGQQEDGEDASGDQPFKEGKVILESRHFTLPLLECPAGGSNHWQK